jgi:hypothetical protein
LSRAGAQVDGDETVARVSLSVWNQKTTVIADEAYERQTVEQFHDLPSFACKSVEDAVFGSCPARR